MARDGSADQLQEYRARRDFSKTAEPYDTRPRRRRARNKLLFVVQKHDATRLHYDFRLEWDGVLKSWAVTRGPSYDPAEKRLAVRTEDHPLAYGDFEGVIPKGQYGGGTVMLWDQGSWEPVGDFDEGLREGKLVFRLDGERLKGEWTLVRMQPRERERRENWLLIKHREDGSRPPRGDVLNKFIRSVTTNRTMAEIARGGRTLAKSDLAAKRKKPAVRAASPKAASADAKMPAWREPQLATLVDSAPRGDEWLSEMKYDGYRTLIAVAGGKARIYTRSGQDWTARFPAIAESAAKLSCRSALIDGEIVAFDSRGRADFSSLQKAIKARGAMSCFVFDLLEQDGEDIAPLPLVERKARLERLVGKGSGALIYSQHIEGHAQTVLDRLCAAGHEGIVAKRANDPYRSGRGRSWLKLKCTRRQEFVIGGYTRSDKRGRPFASVLIGVMEGGKLAYKGRVGAFEGSTLDELAPELASRRRKSSPFASLPREARRDAIFVTPDLVAEIDFAEFTSDGYVRHGVFKGLRADKRARSVVLETPGGAAMNGHEQRDVFAGVKLTNPNKVLYQEQGVTKADLAAHYERVAARMLPHLERRLLSLVRCPDGPTGQCFFQKHESKGFPTQIRKQEITEGDGDRATYLYIDDLAGIIAGVQMGTLEFHIWGSRIDSLEKPDRLVFDLDADEGLDFARVREAAFDLRDRLAAIGLKTVPLVTGGKGIHVIAPLERRAEWPQVKAFARGFAQMLQEEAPERYVAQASKAKRKGRIFVDYLRNERGATAICPWSTRARAGAPIATPVAWDEVKTLPGANTFHIQDMEARLAMADPWAEAARWRQSITKSMMGAVGAD